MFWLLPFVFEKLYPQIFYRTKTVKKNSTGYKFLRVLKYTLEALRSLNDA